MVPGGGGCPPREKKIERVREEGKGCKKMNINMNDRVEKYGERLCREIVGVLSCKYGFSKSEAEEYLKVSKKEEKRVNRKKSIPMPFCGVKYSRCCEGIRLNHGLYTQCMNEQEGEIDGHMVCSTCEKQILKNSNRMPTYGYIDDRIMKGKEFRDPKGKGPVNYGNIMEKLNITREEVEREAAAQGITITEEEFEVKKARRGRPKKDTSAVDTSGSEDEKPKSEKKRGRPKKEKEVVSSSSDSMIKELVKSANEESSTNKETTGTNNETTGTNKETTGTNNEDTQEEKEEAEEEENVEVDKFTFNGKTYLKSTSDNTLYDINKWTEVGVWNPETNSIDDVESDEE